VKISLGISRLEVGRRGVAGGDEEKRQTVGQCGEEDGADRRAPHGSDVREGISTGVRKVEGNTPFGKYDNAAWAEWAERGSSGLWGVAGQRGRG
jgi:hypothetical protein